MAGSLPGACGGVFLLSDTPGVRFQRAGATGPHGEALVSAARAPSVESVNDGFATGAEMLPPAARAPMAEPACLRCAFG